VLQVYDERNRDLIVNIDGKLVHRDESGVSPFDSTVQNGDGVWEGLRLYDGRIFKLRAHLARLRRSAEALAYEGIPDEKHIIEQLRATLTANRMHDGVHVRLTLSRGLKYTSGLDPRLNTSGCTLIILAEHKPPVYATSGIKLITACHRRPLPDVLDQRIHSCNQVTSILAKLEANAAGVDDALMLDTRGNLAETNATHVFIVAGATVITSTTLACPEGITRATVLELCVSEGIDHEVRDVAGAEIAAADEVFCTGTMGEIIGVVEIDGRVVGTGGVGPMTRRLGILYEAECRSGPASFVII